MFFPLCNFTHYSLCKGFSKPEELVAKCVENGYKACGISDYKTLSGAIVFSSACQKADIKPIIGCSFDGFSLFAKNHNGWLDLVELVSSLDKNNNLDNQIREDIYARGNLIQALSEQFPSSYYVNKQDALLHRILLCVGMKTTLPKIARLLQSGEEFENRKFFLSDSYHLLDNIESSPFACSILDDIYNQCDSYQITHPPRPPKFPVPEGHTEESYLKELCRAGWRDRILPITKDEHLKQVYLDRFLHEFEVFKKAILFGYFLIVWDVIRFVESKGWLVGPGRGSAAGCLTSFILGITKIDPIKHDLLFSRFYNEGRNTEGNVAFPDIDIDIPVNKRGEIIEYVRSKYGYENVCQMVTYGRLQGRGAIKEVLRVNEACGFAEMNEITKHIPDEAKIADQLEEMDEEERSIITWALQNNSKGLYEFCFINDNDELDGPYSQYFKQAIAIEGTFKSQGKHASGIVIATEPLHKICPMVNQKHADEKLAGFELSSLEAAGHLKLDLLGLKLLDIRMYIQELVKERVENVSL